ncbi:universal stress protein [Streptomyces sp. NPDC058877]|uniref:universal stress protein n=1 Tax=unclassified Streptomyces TaxID=2593676 RepID=UPI0036BB08BF
MDGSTPRPGLGRVVVGVDGSPSARTAVTWAAAEAAVRRSPLCLVHAVDAPTAFLPPGEGDGARRAGRELLDRTAETVIVHHPDLTVVTELADGAAPGCLRRSAARTGTVVVGHRGVGGFSALLLGSVALEVAAAATTPVVVVRGGAEPTGAGTVLAAVRNETDLGCARAAAREALLRKVPLKLLHVWGTPLSLGSRTAGHGDDEEAARQHVRVLATVSERMREEFPSLSLHTEGRRDPSVPGALVDASDRAGLLVVGGRRAPGYLGRTLGRTTLSLLQHAHCPVDLIPRHGPGHGSTS